MGSSCNSTDVRFPPQDVLLRNWKSNISQWVKNIQYDIDLGATKRAHEAIDTCIVDLLATEDSSQKVFDIYGLAMMLGSLDELKRSKDLQIELSKIVPYTALDVNIAGICTRTGDLDDRVKFMERALEKDPENAVIWNFLGSALMSINEKKRGLDYLRMSAEKRPSNQMTHSNYLFYTHHSGEYDCQKIFTEHKKWGQFNACKDLAMSDHKNIPDLGRKLRIGYISPDFRQHPVGILIKPIIDFRNQNEIEVFCYGSVGRDDLLTNRIKGSCDHYRSIINSDNEKVAGMIVDDKIDILVDLAGHTGGNRLGVLAYKPAPIQVTYLGYFETTGMDQVDYFMTDNLMSPPASEQYHTEELFYLPHTCFCYNIPDRTPEVDPSPVIENGYVTFGIFGNSTKITAEMVSLYARIMQKTMNSRLKLIISGGQKSEMASIYFELFEKEGISRQRLDICGKMPMGKYLSEYGKVDIILDTYPYNGGTTTCDALWMGVPVVSLVGEHHFSRVGLSLLASVGLEYFACKSKDEYVNKACVLAFQQASLIKLRDTMRERMQASDICNIELQARSIEMAYRQMWHRWCKRK